ncbi:MAG: hypothetical protein WCO09_02605 [bacterium]
MKAILTVGYQNRQGTYNDLPIRPKITFSNDTIKRVSGFSIGDKVSVEYLPNRIIILKHNPNI